MKKKAEFSKIIIMIFLFSGLLFTSLSYILSFMGLYAVEELSSEIVRAIWGTDGLVFLCYTTQNGIRAWSRNKYGGGNYGDKERTEGISFSDYPVSESRYEED